MFLFNPASAVTGKQIVDNIHTVVANFIEDQFVPTNIFSTSMAIWHRSEIDNPFEEKCPRRVQVSIIYLRIYIYIRTYVSSIWWRARRERINGASLPLKATIFFSA